MGSIKVKMSSPQQKKGVTYLVVATFYSQYTLNVSFYIDGVKHLG
jgi:hypothetical protein